MRTLFDVTQLGPMQLKNRLWRSATWLNMADDKGHVTDRLEKMYIDLAKGGVGTIITGYAFVREDEQPNPGMLGIYDDIFIPEYREFVQKIKSERVNIVMQIVYGGSATNYNVGNRTIWGPSAVPHPAFGVTPTEMTKADILALEEDFVQAARRVKEAGFDGVQLHGAHTYLFSQFLSPYYNRRQDEYGGSIENRGRIIFETVRAIREAIGEEYPVLIKMHSSDEWGSNGLTVEDSTIVAKKLEELGITAIEFSGGNLDVKNYPNKGPAHSDILKPEAQSYFAQYTARIAQELTIPVISVGGNRTPELMERILNETPIRYFSMSRTLLAEPNLINRWQQGDFSKPRCVSCSKCWHLDGNICILDRKKPK
ncbi:NADH:flavin oxidoreductase [Desulfovibrio inopinatus]|uniref:NADH:flavin oxidoreductase n=1 Tax=Desulfovibrio inopinatus TaxID=102109 RepID=UPI0004058C22|nr:NADH:flavin oxidoreductase [Desulfovibrio inopinatus]